MTKPTKRTSLISVFTVHTKKPLEWRLRIRLGGWPGWSESSLGAQIILSVLSRLTFCSVLVLLSLSCSMTKPTIQPVHQVKPESSLSAESFWVLNYPESSQQRLWSDWADAQADLSLYCVHMSFCSSSIYWLNLPFPSPKKKAPTADSVACISSIVCKGCRALLYLNRVTSNCGMGRWGKLCWKWSVGMMLLWMKSLSSGACTFTLVLQKRTENQIRTVFDDNWRIIFVSSP